MGAHGRVVLVERGCCRERLLVMVKRDERVFLIISSSKNTVPRIKCSSCLKMKHWTKAVVRPDLGDGVYCAECKSCRMSRMIKEQRRKKRDKIQRSDS
jgi:ribosomal protein L14E/L6E/L27E